MDPAVVSTLQLSELEQARLSSLDSDYITPDEAQTMASDAADAHHKLMMLSGYLQDQGFVQYSGYLEDYRYLFLLGLQDTYPTANLGADYYSSFKTQVSDKWQDEPWEANKGYIANFLNDGRASTLQRQNDSILNFFDELPIHMKNLHERIDNVDVLEMMLPGLNVAADCISKINGFGLSWKAFRQDAVLIRDKTEIAIDSKTKTYITERVSIIGDASKTLSEAMAIYAKTLDDKGILDYPFTAK